MKKIFFVFLILFVLTSQWACSGGKPPSSTENKLADVDVSGAETTKDSLKEALNRASVQAAVSSLDANTLSKDLALMAWEASSKNDMPRIQEIFDHTMKYYGEQAMLEQSSLSGFPERGTEEQYRVLNDAATIHFILAEAFMGAGRTQEAVNNFQEIIRQYPSAQSWDPSRGSFWSVAEKSKASIDVLTGKAQEELDQKSMEHVIRTVPVFQTPGTEGVVDYAKYGEFHKAGTAQYEYVIQDMKGLKDAVGEGIYPNERDVYTNPRLEQARAQGRLKGKHWDFNLSEDLEAAYFKWVSAQEAPGVRLFYIAHVFERAQMWERAIKAYYALVVHFPKTVAWTYWQTPWYPAQAAIAKIKYLIHIHPELGLDYRPMQIRVQNGYDNDMTNDVFIIDPGRIVELDKMSDEQKKILQARGEMIALKDIKRKIGKGKVRLVQYSNGHWQMIVDGKPFLIKGVTYTATKVGQSPDKGTLTNWQFDDFNGNGKIDGPYDSWVDHNGNNAQDADEPVVGDFQLMKDMGVNVIRFYHVPTTPNKELLRDMYQKYGIRVIMGDFFGKYTIGSGASWSQGTDYENPEHRKNMMESVKHMVMEYKDEPYILMWILGNENNYGVASNADKKPAAFFRFANEAAQWIKSIDGDHPVAINNGDTLFLDIFAKNAPDIDIFTANAYRGNYGFGSLWDQVAEAADKPALITEYGAPAFAPHMTLEDAEQAQADYHRGNWMDIEENSAGHARGAGNALGGVAFEWMDEWWKNYEPFLHDRKSEAIGPFPGGYYFEEWFGLIGQGNGVQSPFLRHLRKAYFLYQDLWNR